VDLAALSDRSGLGLQGGEVGVCLFEGLGVGLSLGVLGQCPVDAGQARVAPSAFAGGDDQVWAD
jgi:hypothetical protein